VVAGAVDVKDALLQVVVEQVDREERTDSVVPKVVLQVVTEILMEMSVEDQVMTLLEEEAVEAVGTQVIVDQTQAVTVMVLLVGVVETTGQVLTMLKKPKLGLVHMETVETGDIGQETVQVHIMVEQETLPYVMNCNYGTN
tara:strand:- start:1110 stop:1532 length:423 start_codon:yes stop_codon:yes gene_type:complete